ncbi:MAG: glycosyltransferase family 2 protein [Candidatus Krumholzibacteriota bacterium]|nr:glycosyltransferase family 2 protein [Candidatus Krumholzibacteriota bacterium]
MRLSILIPAYDEAESLPALLDALRAHAAPFAPYEILVVDDGSTDGTGELLERLAAADPRVGYVRLGRNYGKSAALAVGFARTRGEAVVTMDADLQDDPAELPALLAKLDEGWDLVSGWKKERRDPIDKTLPSKVWNSLLRRVSGLTLHDFNCGLKAYRGEVARGLRLYGDLHRYVPVLAAWQGWRVTELPVRHHARRFGVSKYGARRFLNGILDLFTVTFIHRRGAAPLHLFGRIAFALLAAGLLINLYFAVVWAVTQTLRVRPLLILGLILVVLGFQTASLGLLGELMIHLRGREEEYRIAEEREPRGA